MERILLTCNMISRLLGGSIGWEPQSICQVTKITKLEALVYETELVVEPYRSHLSWFNILCASVSLALETNSRI